MQEEAGTMLNRLIAFAAHPMIMPAMTEVPQVERPWPRLTVQYAAPGSAGVLGALGVAAWVVLLGLGAWGLRIRGWSAGLPLVLGLSLAAQFVLHSMYGAEEVFLYSLHWLPLLVIVAAFSTFTPWRQAATGLALVLLACAAVNNGMQFGHAAAYAKTHRTVGQALRAAMEERPDAFWPRRAGHVVLSLPGSDVSLKGYHEPGGSFSPSPGSFGVSLWMTDAQGRIIDTSDTIPLLALTQRFVHGDGSPVPSLRTESPYYDAQWTARGAGRWTLDLALHPGAGVTPMLAIRSAGPAGGPIRTLAWDGTRLLVNDRFRVRVEPSPAAVSLAEEGPDGWTAAWSPVPSWRSASGWGYARIELGSRPAVQVTVEDLLIALTAASAVAPAGSTAVVDVPEPAFAESLSAQGAHLLMGLVGDEVRAGEPLGATEPAPPRDAAAVATALAHAGYADVAHRVAAPDLDAADADLQMGVSREQLDARWVKRRDANGELSDAGKPYLPSRPTLEATEARRWLRFGRSDRAWTVLRWLWAHQSSPGLYTWWAGEAEAFSSVGHFHRAWEWVRGWLDRPQLTPHYGAAAQVLLLQLEMLAYADTAGETPVLVIGAGVPPAWLPHRMRVQGIGTGAGRVDWVWDGSRMQATVRGDRCDVRLGAAFAPGTPLQVTFLPGE